MPNGPPTGRTRSLAAPRLQANAPHSGSVRRRSTRASGWFYCPPGRDGARLRSRQNPAPHSKILPGRVPCVPVLLRARRYSAIGPGLADGDRDRRDERDSSRQVSSMERAERDGPVRGIAQPADIADSITRQLQAQREDDSREQDVQEGSQNE